MEYGHFENGGREVVVTCRKTPRHWHNYMYNDEYVAFFSQVGFGEGFAQDGLGRRSARTRAVTGWAVPCSPP